MQQLDQEPALASCSSFAPPLTTHTIASLHAPDSTAAPSSQPVAGLNPKPGKESKLAYYCWLVSAWQRVLRLRAELHSRELGKASLEARLEDLFRPVRDLCGYFHIGAELHFELHNLTQYPLRTDNSDPGRVTAYCLTCNSTQEGPAELVSLWRHERSIKIAEHRRSAYLWWCKQSAFQQNYPSTELNALAATIESLAKAEETYFKALDHYCAITGDHPDELSGQWAIVQLAEAVKALHEAPVSAVTGVEQERRAKRCLQARE
jgi:hypothetical protein